jgi:hypothetical protein
MLQLEKTKRFRDLPLHFKQILEPASLPEEKGNIGLATFMLLDFFYLMFLDPAPDMVVYVTFPFLLFMNIWALWLLFRKNEMFQFEVILFWAILGFVGSLCFFIFSTKSAYMLGYDSPLYYGMLAVIYLGFIFLLFKAQSEKFSTLEKEPKVNQRTWPYTKVLFFSVPIGFMVANYKAGFSYSIAVSFVMVCCFALTLVFTRFLAANYYRYLFFKKNIEYAQQHNKRFKKKVQS